MKDKKILFLCHTYYHLLQALIIKRYLFNEVRVDVILKNDGYSQEVITALQNSELFDNIYRGKNIKRQNGIWSFYFSFNTVKIIMKAMKDLFYSNKFLEDTLGLKNTDYDKFFYCARNNPNNALLCMKLKEFSPDIEINILEDGLGTYTDGMKADFLMKGYNVLSTIILHKRLVDITDNVYVFQPDFVMVEIKCPIKQTPTPKLDDAEFVRLINDIYGVNQELLDEYKNLSFIYFEQPMIEESKKAGEQACELALKIAAIIGKENILYKMHPRTDPKFYIDNGIPINSNMAVPWEAVQMNADFNDVVYITVHSTAVFMSKLLCGRNNAIVLLYKLVSINAYTASNLDRYIEHFTALFPEVKIYVPDSIEELTVVLDILRNRVVAES